jgi:hypothetical protein
MTGHEKNLTMLLPRSVRWNLRLLDLSESWLTVADDIIKYLRLSQTRFNRNAEAADEIERLRSELNLLKVQKKLKLKRWGFK